MKNKILTLLLILSFGFANESKVNKIIVNIDTNENINLSKEIFQEYNPNISSADNIDFKSALENLDDILEKKDNKSSVLVIGSNILNENELKDKLSPYIGKDIDNELIEEIKNDVISELNKKGYYFFAINVSEKNSECDSLQIDVTLGRLGKVNVKGSDHYPKERIAKEIKTCPGEIINPYFIEKDLMWINENPYRSVSLIYSPGERKGTTDITLDVHDRHYYRVYSGYEMTDNNVAGNNRFFAGLNLGKLFLDSQLNYQFMFAPNVNRWYAHSASLIMPLPIRHMIKIFGSYVETHPRSLTNFDLTGRSWTINFNYVVPKIINENIKYQVMLGYNFQRTNNFTDFINDTIIYNNVDISEFILNFDINFNDRLGSTQLTVNGFFSPGKMSRYNKTSYFKDVRKGASAGYAYFNAAVDRIFNLSHKMKYFLSFKGQLSGAKLLPTEEFSLGGFHTVRGYKENDLVGDFGYLIRNEFHAPPLRCFSYLNLFDGRFKKSDEKLIFLGFIDYGRAFEIDKNVQDRKSSWLLSMGPGMRYSINENLFFRLDYGWQVNRVIYDQKNQWHLQLLLSY